jgi:hypothetical protein
MLIHAGEGALLSTLFLFDFHLLFAPKLHIDTAQPL